jgi:hypothetical protein
MPGVLASAMALIGAVQLWILFSPAPKLIIWPDSVGYLAPALDAIELGQFTHSNGRGSGYPLFLRLLLGISQDPTIIAHAQRALVCATYLCLCACAKMLIGPTDVNAARSHQSSLIVVCWLLVYVLYPPAAGLAYLVMPEVLFAFLLSVTCVGLLAAWRARSGPATSACVAVATISAIALPLVKPHALLMTVLVLVAMPFLVTRTRRRRVLLTLGGSIAVAALVMVLPELALQARYDPVTSRTFGPRSLFCNSADLVDDYLARHPSSALAAPVRAALSPLLTPNARAAATDWSLLGFNGDACMYGEPARVVAAQFDGQPGAESRFYLTTYLRAVVDQPTYVVLRLARHAFAFAAKPFNAVTSEYFFRAEPAVLRSAAQARPILQRWLEERPELFTGLIQLPTRRGLLLLRGFFVVAGAVLVLAALATVWFGFVASPDKPAIASVTLLLLGCAVAINGLIAIAHTFEPRYLAMQTPLLALTGMAGCLTMSADNLTSRRVLRSLTAIRVRPSRTAGWKRTT